MEDIIKSRYTADDLKTVIRQGSKNGLEPKTN